MRALYFDESIYSIVYMSYLVSSHTNKRTLVLEHEPVPRHALLEVHNRLIGFLHRPLVDPGVNVLVGGKLQHLPDLSGRADQAAANLDLLHDESESHELRNGVLGSADLDELAADVEEAEVGHEREAGAGDGGDDQVEAVGVLLLVALFGGGDEVVLRRRSADGLGGKASRWVYLQLRA